ncbi:hypothetical protein H2203_006595 [Taxawa tesnikishii (nom. ined.)]|nr:hypothetical protein H2203_006595 [Dothideales sp. JES 119]
MPATAYGNFHDFCRDSGDRHSTLPICNLFNESPSRLGNAAGFGGCDLTGIPLSGGRRLANLGSIIVDGIAILTMLYLLWRSNRKRAAVGRREMQIFLLSYIIISICEIFTIGGFPLDGAVRRVSEIVGTIPSHVSDAFTGFHSSAHRSNHRIRLDSHDERRSRLSATGRRYTLSLALVFGSAAILFIGTGYIALDTGFSWTGYWNSTLDAPNKAYALYTLYQLVPMIFLVVFFLLETVLVLRVLGERRPMLYLIAAALLFIIGQIFQYVISVHLCTSTNGAINGGLFETLFTFLSVVMIWAFWSSITEDDWPMPPTTDTYD